MDKKDKNLEINSYEEFYKSFNSLQKQDKVNLILYLQNYIYSKVINQKDNDFNIGTDELYLKQDKKEDNIVDALTFIIDETLEACKYIKNNMNEKIIREHVMMPSYKVREVDSYSLQWLSRQPGQNIKQKIGSKNSMMAVKRRMSFDTSENQLFCAYINQLSYLLEDKTTYLESFYKDNKSDYIKKEEEIFNLANSIRYDEEFKEIRRWNNLPPNNTLLTNKYYKKVYKAWNDLKDLDDLITDYDNNLESYLLNFIKVELLIRLKSYFYMPQFFVHIDPRYYNVNILSDSIVGLDIHSNVLKFDFNNDNISISYKNKKINLSISNNKLYIKLNKNENKFDIILDELDIYINGVVDIIDAPKLNEQIRDSENQINTKKIYIDLFSLHPKFIDENSNLNQISKRLVMQDIDFDKSELKMSCSTSNAIYLGEYKENKINTYSFSSFKTNINDKQLRNMFSMLKKYVNTNEITFLFPDSIDIFELSKIHTTCRLEYKNVKKFPNSISSIFKYQDSNDFQQNFNKNDVVVVIDIISNKLSLTCIKGHYDEDRFKENSKYKGIIWERYPARSIDIKDLMENLMNNLEKLGCENPKELYELFSIEGIQNELDLMIVYDNQKIFKISKSVQKLLNDFKINVDDKIKEFLIDDMKIKDLSKIHIISLSEMINIKSFKNHTHMTKNEVLDGINKFNKLKEKSEMTLWEDHLPDLSIKMLCSKFDLVKNKTVYPLFNKKQPIDIKETFILPKDKKVQRFKLSQNQLSGNKQYEAVIKNSAFPLKEDVECKLYMTYSYGEEQPYELKFIPLDPIKAGFKEAKVDWKLATFDEYIDLPYPEFPKIKSWDYMRQYPKQNGEGTNDLLDFVSKFFMNVPIKNNEEIIGIKLEEYEATFRYNSKDRFIKYNLDGKEVLILIDVKNSNRNILEIIENPNNRLDLEIKESVYGREYINFNENDLAWGQNSRGYICGCYMNENKVKFLADEFIFQDEFCPDIVEMSCYLKPIKGGTEYIAKEITTKPLYKAFDIRKTGTFKNDISKNLFNLHVVFFGGKSVCEYECPDEIRNNFEEGANRMLEIYKTSKNEATKLSYFKILSLIATDIGPSFYEIAYNLLDKSLNENIDIDYYSIGYALGKYDKEYHKILLDKILKLRKDKVIITLSKAMWKNKEFIFNVPEKILIDLFNDAINILEQECKKNIKVRKRIQEIGDIIAFILGVFRLRELRNEELSYQLSLNNPSVQKLYNLTYYLIEQKIDIKSHLKLKIDKKGIWKDSDICDLLFLLPVYITGEDGESDIIIEGVNE
ncbi:MAG: DUF2357 domain-containing protein [Romboutsia sp.]